ncbi:aspartate--tRNA ligase [Rickettsiales bacterium LUAb2]
MNQYKTHNLNQLTINNVNETVRVSGWIHSKRDHGGLVFIDLRDDYGVLQCVINENSDLFKIVEKTRIESVITVEGKVVKRSDETINKDLLTGEIELHVVSINVESNSEVLPFLVATEDNAPEELRLKYRFLDLRREKLHNVVKLRSEVIFFIRQKMHELGFIEVQTPILTGSSPEGARDFLVPSRKQPGKFYALPQAPQIFKQLLMVSGFAKYFQIAPCFRDEDSRADRSPGEFYQLDFEMSFVTEEEVFKVAEEVLYEVFKKFSKYKVSDKPFPRIKYKDAISKYGSDKPDLRNPLELYDVTEEFKNSGFSLFANLINNKNAKVNAVPATGAAKEARSFYDKLNDWARKEGQGGLGYIIFSEGEAKGPIAGKLTASEINSIKSKGNLQDGDAVFFVCGTGNEFIRFSGLSRNKIAEELNLFEKDVFKFCLITDFPMYELDEATGKIEFSHNPFSMPKGGIEVLDTTDPLEITAHQYDIVCNGVELSSGAIRNHKVDGMYKAFAIAGYSKEQVDTNFSSLINAFKYGAPPHGGSAPGIDRMLMLLTDSVNIREVVTFPLNQAGEDLLISAPSEIEDIKLKELGLKLLPKIEVKS